MKITKLRLDIDRSRYLTFEFEGAIKDLDLFDYITIAYHENRRKYVLYTNDFVIESLRTAEFMLTKALNGELILHESIDRDLGYLWNEYLKDKPGYNFVEVPLEKDSTMWVGQQYDLWWSRQCKTWLYNKDGDIYFEITPGYKWHFLKPKNNEKYISYGKFIKNYKPLVMVKLENKVAKIWLRTVSRLLKIAQKNYDIARAAEDAKTEKTNAICDDCYQTVFQKRNLYTTAHLREHNGGFWKLFEGCKRIGTFDKTLKIRIGE